MFVFGDCRHGHALGASWDLLCGAATATAVAPGESEPMLAPVALLRAARSSLLLRQLRAWERASETGKEMGNRGY